MGSRRRLEIPIFKGEDTYGWYVRVERYFNLNGVRVRDKLDAVVLAMEDKALNCSFKKGGDDYAGFHFLNGLKEEIQAELKLHESQSLAELMDRALSIEENNEVLHKKGRSWRDRGGPLRIRDLAEFGGSKKEGEKVSVEDMKNTRI
ncbi:unnamed protein product [Vicia faba]|uniref:Uncharacterized protein n=1 Tax=Vicia faba TaxID=3906 RepID=A0AAV1AQV8_VICFA|nr:unnamed protein product [Vicia faba]